MNLLYLHVLYAVVGVGMSEHVDLGVEMWIQEWTRGFRSGHVDSRVHT